MEIKEAQDELEANYKELYNAFKQAITQHEKSEDTFNNILERGYKELANVTDLLNVNFIFYFKIFLIKK